MATADQLDAPPKLVIVHDQHEEEMKPERMEEEGSREEDDDRLPPLQLALPPPELTPLSPANTTTTDDSADEDHVHQEMDRQTDATTADGYLRATATIARQQQDVQMSQGEEEQKSPPAKMRKITGMDGSSSQAVAPLSVDTILAGCDSSCAATATTTAASLPSADFLQRLASITSDVMALKSEQLPNVVSRRHSEADRLAASRIHQDAVFHSYTDFDRAFEAWKAVGGHPFRVASSETLKPTEGPLTARFVYRYVVYHCAHYGKPRVRGAGKRPNQSYLPCGCEAMLRLNFSFPENVLKITTLKAEHLNHEPTTMIGDEPSPLSPLAASRARSAAPTGDDEHLRPSSSSAGSAPASVPRRSSAASSSTRLSVGSSGGKPRARKQTAVATTTSNAISGPATTDSATSSSVGSPSSLDGPSSSGGGNAETQPPAGPTTPAALFNPFETALLLWTAAAQKQQQQKENIRPSLLVAADLPRPLPKLPPPPPPLPQLPQQQQQQQHRPPTSTTTTTTTPMQDLQQMLYGPTANPTTTLLAAYQQQQNVLQLARLQQQQQQQQQQASSIFPATSILTTTTTNLGPSQQQQQQLQQKKREDDVATAMAPCAASLLSCSDALFMCRKQELQDLVAKWDAANNN